MLPDPDSIRRIGVFLPNWIGDVCMATPTLRAISDHFGRQRGAHLIGIMRPYVAHVLEGTPWLDETWLCQKRSRHAEYSARHLLRRMRGDRLDAVVLLPNSLRVATLAWLGRARYRIGYARDFRRLLLTHPVRLPQSGLENPLVFRFLRLARELGCPSDDARLELATTAADERRADRVWRELELGDPAQVMALNCGSANSPSRRWPLARFAELARRLVDDLGQTVLVLCGPGEEAIAREVTRLADHPRVVDMADQPLDLGTAKACIRRIALLISTDSGPRHIAVAFNRPVVTLHGPVSPLETFNPTAKAMPVSVDLSCLDCRKSVCPLGHNACMQQMSVDYVFRHVQQACIQFRTAA